MMMGTGCTTDCLPAHIDFSLLLHSPPPLPPTQSPTLAGFISEWSGVDEQDSSSAHSEKSRRKAIDMYLL